MVCQDCEKKLKQQGAETQLACPDPFAKRALMDGLEVGKSTGPRNMLLGKKGNARANNPYDKKCNDCKQRLHDGGLYCQDCAYAKGVCRLCAKVVLSAREFYKSFVSEAERAKYAPKTDRTKEAQPEGAADEQGDNSGSGPAGQEEAFDPDAPNTAPLEPPKKKAKKAKRDDGSDATKARALEQQRQQKAAAEAMADFVADPASGYMYNAKTQQYYDPKAGVYYTYNNGAWYFWNAQTNQYQACQEAAKDPGPPPKDPGPPTGPKPQTPAEIAAEIAGHAGPGSMPLEEARKKAKPAFGGLR